MKKSSLLIAVLAMACTASVGAADLSKLAPVRAFYADGSHCMYMVDNPAEADDAVAQRFSMAVASAVAAMQKAEPSLSLDKALMRLRQGCDESLQAVTS